VKPLAQPAHEDIHRAVRIGLPALLVSVVILTKAGV
jgi:hypothetical protein